MAAVVCKICSKRLPAFYKSATNLLWKSLTSQCAQPDLDNSNHDVSPQSSSEQTRDKLKVLNALASTIQSVPFGPIYGFFEDPFLMPRTSTRKNEFIKAREEGKKAAEYIVKSYPDLFPLRKPEPEWPKELPINIKGNDEKALLDLIIVKQSKKAIRLYEKLISKGEPVSLQCENKLLELTGYYGTVFSDTQPTEGELEYEMKRKQRWSSKNYAHQLFEKMKTKNNRTYEIMILSVLKFQNNELSLVLFDEMKAKDFKGSVFLYNQLIEKSEYLCMDRTDPWTFAQEILHHMNNDPIIQPNIGTFNSLLKVCAAHCTDPYENALKIVRDMYSVDIEPSLACYAYLLEAAERNNQGHVAINDIVAHLKSLNHRFNPESIVDYDFFVNAMATARHFRDGTIARELFQLAESNNYKSFLGRKPLSFYGNLLCSLALSEHANSVMDFYHQLVPKYFVPREWIYVELLRCLEKSKQPHKALELYNDIKQHRVNMTVYTCRSFISCFSVKLAKEHLPDYVRVMEEIFQWMEFFDIELDDFMMSQFIRIYCLNGQFDIAWENMEKFAEKNFVPTIFRLPEDSFTDETSCSRPVLRFAALSSLLQGTLGCKEKDKTKQVFEIMAAQGFRLNASLRNAYYRDLNFTAEESYKIDQLFSNLPARRSSE